MHPHDARFFPERLLLFDRHAGGIGLAQQVRGAGGRERERERERERVVSEDV